MALVFSIIGFIVALAAILMSVLLKTRGSYTFLISIVALCLSYIAVANSYPRNFETNGLDYIGIMVSILGIIVAILVGLQLYNVFRLKEDADQVKNAVEQLEEYKKAYEDLKQKMEDVSKDMNAYKDTLKDLSKKAEHAIYFDYNDGPCDEK